MLVLSLALTLAQADSPNPDCGIDTWHPFEWVDAKRSALLVEAQVNGKTTRFQLDTGSDTSFLYGTRVTRIFDTIPIPSDDEDTWHHVESFSFAGQEPSPQAMGVLEGMRGGRRFAGTIGADLLIGKILVLDYARERLAMLDEDAVRAISGHITSTPAEVRRTKLFVSIESGGTTHSDIFFDSGSSALDLWVDAPLWQRLTGLTGPDQDTILFSGMSWGTPVRYHGAPARDLRIGGQHIADPTVYFREGEPVFEDYPHPAVGLVGNRPFFEQIVVADFGASPSFGFLSCPSPHSAARREAQTPPE
jgi:hypothetical protein